MLIAAAPAWAEVRIEYHPDKKLEPHSEALGLGFWSVESGHASFSDDAPVCMVTADNDTELADLPSRGSPYYRKGSGRYYRRQFTKSEFNDNTNLRVEVTLKVPS